METKPSKAFASIKQGLNEALEFAEGIENKAVIRKLTGAETKERLEADFELKEGGVNNTKRSH